MRTQNALALATLGLLLTSCEAIRAQRQLTAEPEIDLAIGPIASRATAGDPPAEKRFQNIQVLRGLPSSQLYPVMSLMANSLGVTCAHCHTEHFEEESRVEKQMARQMIILTRSINHAQFQGEPTVTCYTCHRGAEYPASVPEIAQAGWQKLLVPKPRPTPLPDAQSILAQYDAALQGAKNGAMPRGRGEISLVGGLDERQTGRFELVAGPGGTVTIDSTVKLPPPVEKALALYRFGAPDLGTMYEETRAVRRKSADGKEAIVIAASSGDDPPDHLLFDASTGLLLRVQRGTSTALGYVPEEIRFSDYRPAGSAPAPFTVEWARGDYLVTLRFAEVAR